jgi:hypothetical protein
MEAEAVVYEDEEKNDDPPAAKRHKRSSDSENSNRFYLFEIYVMVLMFISVYTYT